LVNRYSCTVFHKHYHHKNRQGVIAEKSKRRGGAFQIPLIMEKLDEN
jgi:hypothetical protein